jgi:hypothetical protein
MQTAEDNNEISHTEQTLTVEERRRALKDKIPHRQCKWLGFKNQGHIGARFRAFGETILGRRWCCVGSFADRTSSLLH